MYSARCADAILIRHRRRECARRERDVCIIKTDCVSMNVLHHQQRKKENREKNLFFLLYFLTCRLAGRCSVPTWKSYNLDEPRLSLARSLVPHFPSHGWTRSNDFPRISLPSLFYRYNFNCCYIYYYDYTPATAAADGSAGAFSAVLCQVLPVFFPSF